MIKQNPPPLLTRAETAAPAGSTPSATALLAIFVGIGLTVALLVFVLTDGAGADSTVPGIIARIAVGLAIGGMVARQLVFDLQRDGPSP